MVLNKPSIVAFRYPVTECQQGKIRAVFWKKSKILFSKELIYISNIDKTTFYYHFPYGLRNLTVYLSQLLNFKIDPPCQRIILKNVIVYVGVKDKNVKILISKFLKSFKAKEEEYVHSVSLFLLQNKLLYNSRYICCITNCCITQYVHSVCLFSFYKLNCCITQGLPN